MKLILFLSLSLCGALAFSGPKERKAKCLRDFQTLAATTARPTSLSQVLSACSGKSQFVKCVSSGMMGSGLYPEPARAENCGVPKSYSDTKLVCTDKAGISSEGLNLKSSIIRPTSMVVCGTSQKGKAAILGPMGFPVEL